MKRKSKKEIVVDIIAWVVGLYVAYDIANTILSSVIIK